jgi:hypothetical protein
MRPGIVGLYDTGGHLPLRAAGKGVEATTKTRQI